MQRTKIRVKVPATTANLGPCFDCLGMALDIWNEVVVELSQETTVSVDGQETTEIPADKSNLVYRAMEYLFNEASLNMPGVGLQCHNRIPFKRGLGSSAAAIVGGLTAANLLISRTDHGPFPERDLLRWAVHLEGHPDNVTAALLGGLQLVTQEEHTLLSSAVPVPEGLRAVLFVPEMTIATEEARAVLPDTISRADAVYNVGRVALLVNALATEKLEDLRYATSDRLHQPYRQRLFPAMKVIFAAAMDAGALGVFLSGSGPSVLALTQGREMTVAYEMAEAARKASLDGEVKITRPSPLGTHQVEE